METRLSAPTATFRIWVAGDIGAAKAICRAWCFREGDCVAVTPTTYVYTGGTEEGLCVSVVTYPRFPKPEFELAERAERLALELRDGLQQWGVLVEGPRDTVLGTL